MFRASLSHHQAVQFYKTIARPCYHFQYKDSDEIIIVRYTNLNIYKIFGAAYRLECVHGTVWPVDTITPAYLDGDKTHPPTHPPTHTHTHTHTNTHTHTHTHTHTNTQTHTQRMNAHTLLIHVDLKQKILSIFYILTYIVNHIFNAGYFIILH